MNEASSRPDGRRWLLAVVRGVIIANLPPGFVEEPGHYAGRQTWVVPAELTPRNRSGRDTVPIVAVGEGKTYVSLLLMGLHYDPSMGPWLEEAWAASGCPFRRGAVTLSLRPSDDVPMDVVAAAVARLSVDDVVAYYRSRGDRG